MMLCSVLTSFVFDLEDVILFNLAILSLTFCFLKNLKCMADKDLHLICFMILVQLDGISRYMPFMVYLQVLEV